LNAPAFNADAEEVNKKKPFVNRLVIILSRLLFQFIRKLRIYIHILI